MDMNSSLSCSSTIVMVVFAHMCDKKILLSVLVLLALAKDFFPFWRMIKKSLYVWRCLTFKLTLFNNRVMDERVSVAAGEKSKPPIITLVTATMQSKNILFCVCLFAFLHHTSDADDHNLETGSCWRARTNCKVGYSLG